MNAGAGGIVTKVAGKAIIKAAPKLAVKTGKIIVTKAGKEFVKKVATQHASKVAKRLSAQTAKNWSKKYSQYLFMQGLKRDQDGLAGFVDQILLIDSLLEDIIQDETNAVAEPTPAEKEEDPKALSEIKEKTLPIIEKILSELKNKLPVYVEEESLEDVRNIFDFYSRVLKESSN